MITWTAIQKLEDVPKRKVLILYCEDYSDEPFTGRVYEDGTFIDFETDHRRMDYILTHYCELNKPVE